MLLPRPAYLLAARFSYNETFKAGKANQVDIAYNSSFVGYQVQQKTVVAKNGN